MEKKDRIDPEQRPPRNWWEYKPTNEEIKISEEKMKKQLDELVRVNLGNRKKTRKTDLEK